VLSVPLTAASLWLLMRGARRGEWWVAVLLGIVYAAYTMFAFTSIVAGFMMALLIIGGLWTGNIKLAPAVKTVAVSALVFFAIFLGIYWWSGFSIYECFQVARANETGEHGSGFDDPRRYLLRSTGHVLAYLVSCGFAMAGFALMSLRGRPSRLENPMIGVAAFALATTILVAGFGGSFHGETERVWLFFTPLLALVAGHEWHRRTAKEGTGLLIGVAAVMLLGNCALELLYKHQSRSLRRESGPQAVQMPEATDSD
jgi:hypothetical protein